MHLSEASRLIMEEEHRANIEKGIRIVKSLGFDAANDAFPGQGLLWQITEGRFVKGHPRKFLDLRWRSPAADSIMCEVKRSEVSKYVRHEHVVTRCWMSAWLKLYPERAELLRDYFGCIVTKEEGKSLDVIRDTE